MERGGELMDVPGDPVGQGLGLVVIEERRQVAPRLVAARQLHDPRGEDQAEEQPAQQPEGHRRGPGHGDGGREARRREKDRQQPGLEQQVVPLEAQEVASHGDEGEVDRPQSRESRRLEPSGDHQQRAGHAGRVLSVEEGVARVEPAQGGQAPVALGAELIGDRVEEGLHRQDAAAADEAVDLGPQGDDGDQVDRSQQPEEEPAGDLVRLAWMAGHAPGILRLRARGSANTPDASPSAGGDQRATGTPSWG